MLRASCRIRTNDPEITNHVLWPTELKRRGGQATCIAPLQPTTFAAFPPWRIRRELAVQDLPVFAAAKVIKSSDIKALKLRFCVFFNLFSVYGAVRQVKIHNKIIFRSRIAVQCFFTPYGRARRL